MKHHSPYAPSTSRSAGALVIKLGGRALETPGAVGSFARELASLAAPAILVHGGGRDVSDWCARLGVEARFADGLRVTDETTIEVVAAVLAGLANKRLVAGLRAAGVDAAGVSGADGGLLDVEPHPDHARLGAVGHVRSVRLALLDALLGAGMTPVVSSVASLDGRLLNVNADDAAAAIAAAIGARALLLLSDVEGLSLGGRLVRRLAAADVDAAIAGGEVRDGMIPKLRAARLAVDRGAGRAVIGAWKAPGSLADLLADDTMATAVLPRMNGEARHV